MESLEENEIEPSVQSSISDSPDQEKPGVKPNPRFKNYADIFKTLVKQHEVQTMYPILSMIITYDSTKAITVSR